MHGCVLPCPIEPAVQPATPAIMSRPVGAVGCVFESLQQVHCPTPLPACCVNPPRAARNRPEGESHRRPYYIGLAARRQQTETSGSLSLVACAVTLPLRPTPPPLLPRVFWLCRQADDTLRELLDRPRDRRAPMRDDEWHPAVDGRDHQAWIIWNLREKVLMQTCLHVPRQDAEQRVHTIAH